jgi:N-glycosylase/DNA lyase
VDGLLRQIESLKNSPVKQVIDKRIAEFRQAGQNSSRKIFNELSYCLLTANFNAIRTMMIEKEIGDGFLSLPERELAGKLRGMGHRFPEARAKYIAEARKHAGNLKEALQSFRDESELRDWVVQNVKGLGYKEASHFLRNIGYENFAIIDFHIIDLLVRYRLIQKPKTLTKVRYMEIENLLRSIAAKTGLSLAELDLYLWYLETGKVLK